MDLYTNTILQIIRKHPDIIMVNNEELKKLFMEECYRKLESIRDALYDIELTDRQCRDKIYEILFKN